MTEFHARANLRADALADQLLWQTQLHPLEAQGGRNNLLSLVDWSNVGQSGDQKHYVRTAADTTPPPQNAGDRGPFDPNVPLSNYDDVAPGVHRSGRPNGDAGVQEIVKDIWGADTPQNAAKTTIIDLRGPVSGKFAQANDQEIKAEQQACAKLGITHKNFSFDSHSIESPAKVQSVLDYIDSEVARGQQVDFHCYHGRDRTGLIAAAYAMTHDPALIAQLKKNPNAAFQHGLDDMKQHGFDPKQYPEMVQNLKAFSKWKSKELNHKKHTAEIIDLTPDIYSKAG